MGEQVWMLKTDSDMEEYKYTCEPGHLAAARPGEAEEAGGERAKEGGSNQGDGFAAEAEEGSSPRGSDGSPAFMELQDSSVDHGRHLTASPICNMINEHINICIIHFLVHQIYKTCYSNISLVINW